MVTDSLILIGAGGHGRVVFDAARLSNRWQSISVRDDVADEAGKAFGGVSVIAPAIPPQLAISSGVHVAIGNNSVRRRFAAQINSQGVPLLTIVHPAAVIAANAHVEEGAFVAARAIVAPQVVLGAGCIVNHGAIVDHDCKVGAWTHIAPGAILGGGVHVGNGVLLGAGCVILPGVRIGDSAIVGAGAVVTKDVPADVTLVGVPAKRIHSN